MESLTHKTDLKGLNDTLALIQWIQAVSSLTASGLLCHLINLLVINEERTGKTGA